MPARAKIGAKIAAAATSAERNHDWDAFGDGISRHPDNTVASHAIKANLLKFSKLFTLFPQPHFEPILEVGAAHAQTSSSDVRNPYTAS